MQAQRGEHSSSLRGEGAAGWWITTSASLCQPLIVFDI